RRHTRFSRDWSSDVCSSDLGRRAALKGHSHPPRREWPFSAALRPASFPSRCSSTFVNAWREDTDGTPDPDRAGIRRQHETEPARVDACAAPPAPGGGTLVVAELDEVRPGRKPEV